MINAKKNPPFNCYLKQNFYLKGEILDNVLENYLQILEDHSKSPAGSKKYSLIKDVIVHNRRNNATGTIYC